MSRERICVALPPLIAIVAALPFFYAAGGRMAEAHDLYIHSMRMIQFDETLRSGVWYPRWLGGMNHGYGAATTLFYPPFFYYATSGAHALLGNWPGAIQAVVLLVSAGSALAFYAYARRLAGVWGASVGAAIYVLLPYRLIDLYHRGAFPELMSFVWMPLVMFCLSGVPEGSTRRIVTGGVVLALLVITHPPMAYLFGISLVVFAAVRVCRTRSWKPVARLGVTAALGVLISAFYLAPALIESPFAKENVTQSFHYDDGFITDLLGGARFQRMIGVTILITTALFVLYSLIALSRTSSAPSRPWRTHSLAWATVGVLAIFMMTPLSIPIVRVLPGIEAVAFPWRWLAILGLATASLAAIAVEQLGSKAEAPKRGLVFAAALAMVGSVLFGGFSSGLASNLSRPFTLPAAFLEEDFTPKGTPAPSELPREASVATMSGRGENVVQAINWKPNEQVIEADFTVRDAVLVSRFMFPGWQGYLDGRSVELDTYEPLGTILVDVPAGNHIIRLVFGSTAVRRRAERVSGAAFGLCLVALAMGGASGLLRHIRRVAQRGC